MNIEYNECYDFGSAIYRFAERKGYKENKLDLGLSGLPQIESWVIELEKNLSPFLLNDIELMITQMSVSIKSMMLIIKKPTLCRSMEEFFLRLDKLTPEEFSSVVRNVMSLDETEEITANKIKEDLIEHSTDAYREPDKQADLILSLMATPHEYLSRLKIIYREFYKLAYVEYKEKFLDEAESLLNWHRKQAAGGPLPYLNGITTGLYSYIFQDRTDIPLYFSYFGDTDTHITTSDPRMIIGAGTKEKFLHHSNRKRSDIFLNLMGDKKRLAIMRLLAKRPWYSNELAQEFKLTPATMSYHLNKLVSAGLAAVQSGKQNRFYYIINEEQIEKDLEACRRDLLT